MNLSLISIYGKLNVVHCKKVCKVGKALRNMNALKLNHKCLKQPQRALYYGERFIKNYICPFKRSKLYCDRYLSIQSMLGKKGEKTYFSNFSATRTYLKLILLVFFLLFYEPFPNINSII